MRSKEKKKIFDANERKCVVSAISERAQTLPYCPGRYVSAQLCSQPNCGSDPFPWLIRHTKSPGDSDSFPVNPIFIAPRLLCHHYRLTCSIVLEAGSLHLNISLQHNNTLNMPQDMIYTGHRRRSHISAPQYNCRRLRSVTQHAHVSFYDKLSVS